MIPIVLERIRIDGSRLTEIPLGELSIDGQGRLSILPKSIAEKTDLVEKRAGVLYRPDTK